MSYGVCHALVSVVLSSEGHDMNLSTVVTSHKDLDAGLLRGVRRSTGNCYCKTHERLYWGLLALVEIGDGVCRKGAGIKL